MIFRRYHSSLIAITEAVTGENSTFISTAKIQGFLTRTLNKDINIPELSQEQMWEKHLQMKIRKEFYSTEKPPILFRPNKNSQLDFNINRLMKQLDVRVPILHIEKNMYLIGSKRCNCSLKGDTVLVRVGGGYERFEKYVASNHYQF